MHTCFFPANKSSRARTCTYAHAFFLLFLYSFQRKAKHTHTGRTRSREGSLVVGSNFVLPQLLPLSPSPSLSPSPNTSYIYLFPPPAPGYCPVAVCGATRSTAIAKVAFERRGRVFRRLWRISDSRISRIRIRHPNRRVTVQVPVNLSVLFRLVFANSPIGYEKGRRLGIFT